MKIMKFGDFTSTEVINENNSFLLEEDVMGGSEMNYTIMKDGFMFDFTDLYVNIVNKNV